MDKQRINLVLFYIKGILRKKKSNLNCLGLKPEIRILHLLFSFQTKKCSQVCSIFSCIKDGRGFILVNDMT